MIVIGEGEGVCWRWSGFTAGFLLRSSSAWRCSGWVFTREMEGRSRLAVRERGIGVEALFSGAQDFRDCDLSALLVSGGK
jgi:hypothetical protein